MHFLFEPFSKRHSRDRFSCGAAELDNYLEQRISQDTRRRLAQAFIAREPHSNDIAGFYTLSAVSIEASSLPEHLAKKLPRYPLPGVLIGRLAVDLRYQGLGLGKTLLADALKRALRASSEVAMFAALVDARDEEAAAFYIKFGFVRFHSTPLRLYLPLGTAQRLLFRE